MNDEAFKNLSKLADDLIRTTAEEVAAEGADNFIEYCQRAMTSLKEAGMRVGRGRLMVELGLKISYVREGSKAITAGLKLLDNPTPKKARATVTLEKKASDTPRHLHPDPYGMAAALPIPGCNPNDPDDAEW